MTWKIHGPLGLCSLFSISSLDWALLGCGPSPSCLAHVIFFYVFVGFLAGDPATPLHYFFYVVTSLLFLCFTWAYRLRLLPIHFLHPFPFWAPLANIPTMLTHFPHPYHFLALLDHIPIVSTHFSHLYLFLGSIGPHSCCASPFHSSSFLGPFTSALHLLLSWAFAKSFRLPQPDYRILTSYYLLDLLAFMPTLWIYLLIIWASLAHLLLLYLLLFSWFYYFIYWASSTHLLLVCHLLFLWACWPLFLPFRPASLCFTIFSSHFLYIVGFLLPLGILSKVGINIQPPEHMNCSCNSYVNTWKFFLFFLFFSWVFWIMDPTLFPFLPWTRLSLRISQFTSYSGTQLLLH